MQASASRPARRGLAIAIAALVIFGTFAAAWWFWHFLQNNPITEDATIQAYVVHVSPAVPGTLAELHVTEGSRVKRGDLLYSLETDVYELRVKQAQAEVAVAEAALSTRTRQIRAETANSSIASEQISRARSNLELAEKTVQRLRPLAAKGYVPQQELDTAVTMERDARISFSQALSQADAARELVGELNAAEAVLEAARVTLAIAEKALHDTQVYAPNNGLVVGLTVSTGERLIPGQSLFTLIDTENWYAIGYFRETELLEVHEGACVSAYTMTAPDRLIQGKVISIGWGVANEDMISLPRVMPIVQRSLNWVRVAQRFPVRVRLDDPPADLMRVGASATVVVRPHDTCSRQGNG